jgi:hypothetical protein
VKVNPTFNRYKLEKIDVLSDEIRMIEDKMIKKKNDKKLALQKQKEQLTSGFSFMNKFNIFSASKDEEVENVAMDKEET